jgi:hypothetical protein
VTTYDGLVADDRIAAGPFDVVALNFALLGDDVALLLRALARRLAADGALVLQTVHPWTAAGEGAYADGWRVETFDALDGAFPASMPWYFRTLGSWVAQLRAARLILERVEEPVDAATGRPLSVLFTAVTAGARR